MDPSGLGTCAQAQPGGEESKAQHLPFNMSLGGAFPDVVGPNADDPDSITAPGCELQPSDADCRGGKANELLKKTKEQRGWRKVIRNFTPS